TVDNLPTKKGIEEVFKAWENGDILEMEALTLEEIEGNPELKPINEKLLDERNFSMVERIEEFLQDDETYFVIVGAAHLVGENGIIRLLEESGYMPVQL
ncbi:MAG: TraB/GumN family protein, partial [bacterium]|nr:TraB/GumN family protein [bacterium]